MNTASSITISRENESNILNLFCKGTSSSLAPIFFNNNLQNQQQHIGFFADNTFDQSYYRLIEENKHELQKDILMNFASKILKESINIEKEIVNFIDEEFWELI